MLPEWAQFALLLGSPIFAAGGAWAATRVTLKWHWHEIQGVKRDARRAHERIDRLEGFAP